MINDFFLINFIKKKKKFVNENIYLKLSNIRNCKVLKEFVGLKVAVYNGKNYIPFKITDNMIGKPFGIFSFSKSILIKKKKNKYLDKKNKKK